MKHKEIFSMLRNIIYYNMRRTKVPIGRIINIELTNRCNQQCIFCPVNRKDVKKPIVRKKTDMKIEDFERIIKNYKKYCYLVNISHHGESFLHPNFREAIAILKKYKVPYSITTNGSLVGNFIDILEEYPPEKILFSLYTIYPKKFQKLTTTGDLEIVLKNIDILLKMKKDGRINTKIIIRAIRMYGFEDDIEKLKEYFKGKDVEWDIDVLNSWAGRVDISKYGDVSKHTVSFKYCFQPWNNCIIGSDLGVYICNNHEDEPIDYLTEDKTLEDIWNSEKYQKIRSNILSGQFRKNEICEGCDYFNLDSFTDKPSLFFFLGKTFLYKILYTLRLVRPKDLSEILMRLNKNGENKDIIKKNR